MKITLRPLSGPTFEVELDDAGKVEDLKKQIAESKPGFQADQQKLICKGKVLVDGTRVSEIGLQPNDFVVVMVSKPKPEKATPAANATAAAGEAPTGAATATAPVAAPDQPPLAPAAATAVNVPATEQTATASTIAHLCEMGFAREQVEKCLRAAFNNADRAVEYLMNGIPASVEAARDRSRSPRAGHGGHGDAGHGHGGHGQGHGQAGHEAHGHDCSGHAHGGHEEPGHACAEHGHGSEGAHGHGHGDGHGNDGSHGNEHGHGHGDVASLAVGSGGAGAGGAHGLQAILTSPRLAELRDAVQQNPGLMPQMLQALAQSHPGLAQTIAENREEFMALLRGGGGDDGEALVGDDESEGVVTVQVSAEDQAAVERLAALGFSKDQALEAYLACDRKEELAANFLFDTMGT